jgi:hypothetical protein
MNKLNRLTESDINRIVKRTIKEAMLREGWAGGMKQAMGQMAGNTMGQMGNAKARWNTQGGMAAQGGMAQGQQQQGINTQTVQSLQQVYQMLGQVIKSLNNGQ